MSPQRLFQFVSTLDRRIIFVCIALALIVPLVLGTSFEDKPSTTSTAAFQKVESLPSGSLILFSMDYDPQSAAELEPMAKALTRHHLLRKHKIIYMALWANGQELTNDLIKGIIEPEFPDLQYGSDYVNLGYKAGEHVVINTILTNLRKLYFADVRGTALDQLPLLQGVQSIKDAALITEVSGGWPGDKEWIKFGGDPSGVPLIIGTTAVGTPLIYPYFPQQVVGLLGGLKGAAEYESALMKHYPQYADKRLHIGLGRMGPQTIAHVVIIAFIVLGNLAYFATRDKRTQRT